VAYSVEALPGVDLGVRKQEIAEGPGAYVAWFDVVAAWILVPLFAAGVTGLVRRRE
jgi:hypothetical protein